MHWLKVVKKLQSNKKFMVCNLWLFLSVQLLLLCTLGMPNCYWRIYAVSVYQIHLSLLNVMQ